MNKLYTILLIVFLAGCSYQLNAYTNATQAFRSACKADTINTNLTSTDTMMTITATCVKEK